MFSRTKRSKVRHKGSFYIYAFPSVCKIQIPLLSLFINPVFLFLSLVSWVKKQNPHFGYCILGRELSQDLFPCWNGSRGGGCHTSFSPPDGGFFFILANLPPGSASFPWHLQGLLIPC